MTDKPLWVPSHLSSEDGSPIRQMVAQAHGQPFRGFRSLEEPQAAPDGVVILEGDEGGTVYVVAPARLVRCSRAALDQLLLDVDALKWNNPALAHVYFESWPLGSVIPGGCGGGGVTDDAWVHKDLKAVEQGIRAVIMGDQERISVRR